MHLQPKPNLTTKGAGCWKVEWDDIASHERANSWQEFTMNMTLMGIAGIAFYIWVVRKGEHWVVGDQSPGRVLHCCFHEGLHTESAKKHCCH